MVVSFTEVWLVYKTDAWHSYNSRDIIAICTNKSIAIELAKDDAKKHGEKITKPQLWNLRNILQTQGHVENSDFEYQLEKLELNTLF